MAPVFIGRDKSDLILAATVDMPFEVCVPFTQQVSTFPFIADQPNRLRLTSSKPPAVFGKLTKVNDLDSSVMKHGSLFPLPLQPTLLPQLFRSEHRIPALRNWVKSRLRNSTAHLTGSYQEERNYQDWVLRRVGKRAYEELYAAYAQKRWGLEPHQLSSALACYMHFLSPKGDLFEHVKPVGALLRDSITLLQKNSTIHWNCKIRRLIVREGKVAAFVTKRGEQPISEKLYCSLPPYEVVKLLGDEAPKSILVDCDFLRHQDTIQVIAGGDFSSAPCEVHFLDADVPAYRMFLLDQQTAVFELGGQTSLEVLEKFITSLSGLTWAKVNRELIQTRTIESASPIWHRLSHFRLRRVIDFLHNLGIRMVGPHGLFSHMDLGRASEIFHLIATTEDSVGEVLRNHVEPPVRVNDYGVKITDFVLR